MEENEIQIRPALPDDTWEIWRLLHNDQHPWDLEKVRHAINELYVLIYKQKLLGVLHGSFSGRKGSLDWVSIHPMFPEDSLRAAMVCGLFGVLSRQPCSDIPR